MQFLKKKNIGFSSLRWQGLLLMIFATIFSITFIYHTQQAAAQTEDMVLSFTVYLHGIGNSGDVLNPTNIALSNKRPTPPDRTVTVTIYNGANQLVLTKTGILDYESATGNFIGKVKLGNTLTGGYAIKIQIPGYLKKRIPGTYRLTSNGTLEMPPVSMIAGDFNGDNVTNIIDFNFLKGCYKDFLPTAAFCDQDKLIIADLSSDGKVNVLDYSLFLREIVVRTGD